MYMGMEPGETIDNMEMVSPSPINILLLLPCATNVAVGLRRDALADLGGDPTLVPQCISLHTTTKMPSLPSRGHTEPSDI